MSGVCVPGSGELEFEEFCTLAARFLVEEDSEAMQQELREAFRLYDKEGIGPITHQSKLFCRNSRKSADFSPELSFFFRKWIYYNASIARNFKRIGR